MPPARALAERLGTTVLSSGPADLRSPSSDAVSPEPLKRSELASSAATLRLPSEPQKPNRDGGNQNERSRETPWNVVIEQGLEQHSVPPARNASLEGVCLSRAAMYHTRSYVGPHQLL